MIRFEINKHIAQLTFDHDAKRNALSFEMLDEIYSAFDKITDDIRVFIIKANKGAKVWSAG
ncbi:MAG: hypothetical protein DSY76_05650, partial [Bacteroidetes bacterium]